MIVINKYNGIKNSLLVIVVSLLIAISYGIDYGFTSNQSVYLIHGIRIANKNFLSNDWWASSTTHYHGGFAKLVSLLYGFNIMPWMLAILNIVLIVLTMYMMYLLISKTDTEFPLTAWLLFTLLFVVISKTESIAASYLLSQALQPSTISSVAIIAALVFFIRGNMICSGVFLAIAGYYHTNYLLLGLLMFGMANIIVGLDGLFQRFIKQLTLSLMLLIGQLTNILFVMKTNLTTEFIDKSNYIFNKIAVPLHYDTGSFIYQVMPLFAWTILAIPCLRVFRQNDMNKRWVALYTSLLLLVVSALFLTTVVYSNFVNRLFIWRLAPLLLMFAHIVISVRLSNLKLLDGDRKLVIIPVLISGFTSLVYYLRYSGHGPIDKINLLAISICCLILMIKSTTRDNFTAFTRNNGPITAINLTLIVLLSCYSIAYNIKAANFSMINDFYKHDNELFSWARTTDSGSMFVTPPMLSSFRLLAERAIVVDWKALPFRADEIIEWHNRITDICGTESSNSKNAMRDGYNNMDIRRFDTIANKYNLDFIVLIKGTTSALLPGKTVFENDKYRVLKLYKAQ